MLKQQTVQTTLGPIILSSLNLSEMRQLDQLFKDSKDIPDHQKGIASLLSYMPLIHASARKVQQDMTLEQMESSLTLEDFNTLFSAMLEVSGLKKAETPAGELVPVPV